MSGSIFAKPERYKAIDIRGLRESTQLLLNFIMLYSDPIALNKFVSMWLLIVRLII